MNWLWPRAKNLNEAAEFTNCSSAFQTLAIFTRYLAIVQKDYSIPYVIFLSLLFHNYVLKRAPLRRCSFHIFPEPEKCDMRYAQYSKETFLGQELHICRHGRKTMDDLSCSHLLLCCTPYGRCRVFLLRTGEIKTSKCPVRCCHGGRDMLYCFRRSTNARREHLCRIFTRSSSWQGFWNG